MSSDTLDQGVAEAVLRAWDGKKVTLDSGKRITSAWLGAKGYHRDPWGNYIVEEGKVRWHYSKQVLHQQEKSFGDWRDRKSLAIIDTANVLLTKAARTLGREKDVEKLLGHREARKEQREKRTSRQATKRMEETAQVWATKLVAQRDPEGYVQALTGGDTEQRREFYAKAREAYQQCLKQLEAGGAYSDGEIASTDEPPFAAFFDKRCRYEWNEDVQGVPYTFLVQQKSVDVCEVHIGKPTETGMTGRIDPMTHMEKWDTPTVNAKGDGYISGYVERRPGKAPVAVLFFISSHEKQQGAGSRMLDAWCSMMSGWGVERWIVQAVGEEGEAFVQAKVRSGRLALHGRSGRDLVVSCVGGAL